MLLEIGEAVPVIGPVCELLVSLIDKVQSIARLADDMFAVLKKVVEIAKYDLCTNLAQPINN